MVASYINYFRSLAIAHADLQHDPASETGDGPIGSMHFTKISPDEVLKALRTNIGFPCMTLELYDTELQSQVISDIKQLARGSFMIIDNPASDSSADEEAVFVKCEQIVFDILKRTWQDQYAEGIDGCGSPFKFFDFNSLDITPVSKIFSGQSGYRVIFGFELQNTYDITSNTPSNIIPFPPSDTPFPQYIKDIIQGAGISIDKTDPYKPVISATGNSDGEGGGADGKSAYEIAAEEGFLGTETEWLASLKGTDGIDGTNGINGTDGTDGTNGVDGTDGQGVPPGGTAGQILSKIDGTDYNTYWEDAPNDDGGPDTNFANNDLTADGDRTHDFTQHKVDLNNLREFNLAGFPALSTVPYVVGPGSNPPQFFAAFDGTNDGLLLSSTDATVPVILNVDGTNTSPIIFTRTDFGGGNFVYVAPKQTGASVTCVSYTANIYIDSILNVEKANIKTATFSNDILVNGYTLGNGSGSNNSAFGDSALQNSTGSRNTAIGNFTLQNNVFGEDNVAVGNGAGLKLNSGQNTAVGSGALNSATSGNNNTAIGESALYSNLTGSNNTAVGRSAGYTGEFNNTTCLGAGSVATKSNQVILGSSTVTEVFTAGNILSKIASKSDDPTTSDIPEGFTSVYKNTSSGIVSLWANNSGTMVKISLS